LKITYGRSRQRTDDPVNCADIISSRSKPALNCKAICLAQPIFIKRETTAQRPSATNPIGQMPDRNRVKIRIIVAFDDVEVVRDCKANTVSLRLDRAPS